MCNISKPSINCSFFSLSLKKFRSEDGKYFFALGQGLCDVVSASITGPEEGFPGKARQRALRGKPG